MTSVAEETLYDVLEVEPRATVEEIRAAHARAEEAFGPESIAVYALVDDAQVEALRERLAEAAEVLLDPARRASYDRSIGLQGPGMLWEEDEEDLDEARTPEPEPEEPVGPGPHPLAAEAALEVEAAEEPAPEQRALDLDIAPAPGPFGRGPPEAEAEEVAAAEPEEVAAAPEPAPDAAAGTIEPPAAAPEASASPSLPEDWAAAVAEAAPPPPVPETTASAPPVVPEPDPGAPPAAPAPWAPSRPPPLPRSSLGLRRPTGAGARASATFASPGGGEGAARARLDIPPDAEFNGELLRQVRESYGLSLQQVSERTRITRIHLENVEADRYDNLPATVYLRGILVNLARELRLDPARVSKSYLLVAQRAQARGP
jgi:hypothetical protein